MDRRGAGTEGAGWLWRRPAAALAELRAAAGVLGPALAESVDLEAARRTLRAWIEHRRRALLDEDGAADRDDARPRAAVEVLEGLCGRRRERRVGFSTLALLRRALGGDLTGIAAGFLLEIAALLHDATGTTDAAGLGALDDAIGREPGAGAEGSERLDAVGAEVWRQIGRFPTGLDNAVIERRDVARRRILAAFGGSDEDWDDPRWHRTNSLWRTPAALDRLRELVDLRAAESEAIEAYVRAGGSLVITPFQLSLLDLEGFDPEVDDAIRARVLLPWAGAEASPTRAGVETVVRGGPLVAALDLLCAPRGVRTEEALDRALDSLAESAAITDVRIVGGDPLLLADAVIERIMGRLAAMPHVTHVRWETRALVRTPMRITPALAGILGRYHEPGRRSVAVVAHVASALEVTPELVEAAARLRCQGVGVYNDLRFAAPSSRRFEAVATRLALARAGVEPGAETIRAGQPPLARLLQERGEEASLSPDLLRADELLLDAPGSQVDRLVDVSSRELVAIRGDGRRVYMWRPQARAGAPTRTWLHVDAAVADYLDDLAERGEDPDAYASIWHYR
ncbi:MAG: hypothetical protein KC486_15000 [Myxococcales bacterium]|nr:hypothetical protein [Myxococcales bacterium]